MTHLRANMECPCRCTMTAHGAAAHVREACEQFAADHESCESAGPGLLPAEQVAELLEMWERPG